MERYCVLDRRSRISWQYLLKLSILISILFIDREWVCSHSQSVMLLVKTTISQRKQVSCTFAFLKRILNQILFIAHKDEETGKPITGPRNFLTRKGHKGHADDVYF